MVAALLLVDVQEDFFRRPGLVPSRGDLISRLQVILGACRASGLPVFHMRTRMDVNGDTCMPHWQDRGIRSCVVGTAGYEPPEELAAHPNESVLHKKFFSAFSCPDLAPALEDSDIDTLVIAGLYTHGCIRASVVDAYEHGLQVFVADDAVGSCEPIHAELSRDWLNGRAAQFLPHEALFKRVVANDDAVKNVLTTPPSISDICTRATIAGQSWSDVVPAERAVLLRRWANLLEQDADALTTLLAREVAKPIAEAADEVRRTLAHIRFAAELCDQHSGAVGSSGITIRYRPVGTVALITPWNNPLAIPAGKLAPALGFGNSCVWKPSPQAPECARRLLRGLVEAGLPEGVVELIEGDATVARQLVKDAGIDAVALTGSSATGDIIAALCTAYQKPLQAELGGNNAVVILDDWCFDDAALTALARNVFGFAGQRCTAIRRLIVQRGILVSFTERFAAAVRSLRLGNPLDPATDVGPLISVEHCAKVQNRLDAAIAIGATVIAQASLPTSYSADLPANRWLAPTLLGDVEPGSILAIEETFGPVAIIFAVDELKHAITVANSVPQGLVAALYSDDTVARAYFAEQMQAGILKLGSGALSITADAPFCGWKSSAIGPPEHGIWDREFYTRVQAVY